MTALSSSVSKSKRLRGKTRSGFDTSKSVGYSTVAAKMMQDNAHKGNQAKNTHVPSARSVSLHPEKKEEDQKDYR